MQSKEAKAFDLSAEPAASRSEVRHRPVRRGRACWPAGWSRSACRSSRSASGGWDTHQDNFDRVKNLSGQVDPADRGADRRPEGPRACSTDAGRLDGRVRPHAAHQHPRRQAGPRPLPAGLEPGHVRRRHQGRPGDRQDRQGRGHASPSGRPTAQDFLATVCELLGIDYTKKNETPTGRPIQIVEKPKPFTGMIV